MQTTLITTDPIDALRFERVPRAVGHGVAIYSPADHRRIGSVLWRGIYNPRIVTDAAVGWTIELWRVTLDDEPVSWWLERYDEVRQHVADMLARQWETHPDLLRLQADPMVPSRRVLSPTRFSRRELVR